MGKKSKLLMLGVLIIAVALPLASCFLANASSEVSLEINQFYTNSVGFGHVVVTVTNNTSRPISDIWVHFTYYDSSGEPVGSDDHVIAAAVFGESLSPYESYTDEFIVLKDVMDRGVSKVEAEITSFYQSPFN